MARIQVEPRSSNTDSTLLEGFWRRGVPCLSYASSSVYMTLAQKYVVVQASEVKSIFLFFQNAAALLMFIPSSLGWLSRFHIRPYKFWDTSLALEVLPLGVTYTIMLWTSNVSLSLLTVPMVSVLKNLGPIAITLVEAYTDNAPISTEVLSSMIMLTLGSLVAGYNDLKFDLAGYLAMFFNVLTNILHVTLTKRIQKRGRVRKEVSLHYQSIFMCFFLTFKLVYEDVTGIIDRLLVQSLSVRLAFLSTGINGIIIALCSMWCIEATSGSTYSMVGALNKIPSSVLGILIFHDPINLLNLAGVSIGLGGGIIFTMAKMRQTRPRPEASKAS